MATCNHCGQDIPANAYPWHKTAGVCSGTCHSLHIYEGKTISGVTFGASTTPHNKEPNRVKS